MQMQEQFTVKSDDKVIGVTCKFADSTGIQIDQAKRKTKDFVTYLANRGQTTIHFESSFEEKMKTVTEGSWTTEPTRGKKKTGKRAAKAALPAGLN